MFIRIRHQLRYLYDRPVFLEPTALRLTPRQDATQRLLHHVMDFHPQPQGKTWAIEPDGSSACVVWFADMHDRFVVDCESIVQTLRDNPFDSIVTFEEFLSLPAVYPPVLLPVISPFLTHQANQAVGDWASSIAQSVAHQTQPFLMRLIEEIHGSFRIVERAEGEPYAPEQTLVNRCGACRDVTMLFIEACRSQGVVARFVSGYSLNAPPETTEHELHAWAEVYQPGGGWRGYDPSLGLAVADGHIAIATGPDHRLAAPLTGAYRGTGATSRLEYDIELRAGERHEEVAQGRIQSE